MECLLRAPSACHSYQLQLHFVFLPSTSHITWPRLFFFISLCSCAVLFFFPSLSLSTKRTSQLQFFDLFFSCVCTVMSLFSVIVIVTLIPSCCPPFYSSLLPCTDWIGLSRFSIDWYHTFFLLSSHLHDVHLNSNLQRLQLN